MLAVFLNKLLGKSSLLRDLLNQFLVIESDPEFLCHHLTNGSSTASKLTANCDNTFTHRNTSISFVYYIIFFPTL